MLLRVLGIFVLQSIWQQSITEASQQHLPCAAMVHQYPLAKSTTTDDDNIQQQSDSSGYEPPIYDEFIATVSPFDFSAIPNDHLFLMNNCTNVSNITCSFDDADYVVDIDRTVSLAFCKPVDRLFQRDCQNTDGIIRVIGNIHSSGEALTTVNQVFMFCKCERGYRRMQIELWTDGLYAFVYKCA